MPHIPEVARAFRVRLFQKFVSYFKNLSRTLV